MAFWKAAGFSQPSPIEVGRTQLAGLQLGSAQCTALCCCGGKVQQCAHARVANCALQQILDKEEFTLEELLDEDDIIQECKSLNGRLITL